MLRRPSNLVTGARVGVPADIRAAWRQLTGDPLGVLAPTGGVLLIQLAAAHVLRTTLWDVPWWRAALLAVGIELSRQVVAAPLRALTLRAGARVLGRPIRGGWIAGSASLVGVELALGLATVLVAGVLVVPTAFLAAFLASRGIETAAVLVGACGLLAALALTLVVRSVLAYARPEAVIGGQAPLAALSAGLELGQADLLALVGIHVLSDTAVALGTLPCGVGALPTYPLADLAVLSRWNPRPSRGTSG